MKTYLKVIIAIFNKFILLFNSPICNVRGNHFYRFRLLNNGNNKFSFHSSSFEKSIFNVSGKGNKIISNCANWSNSEICIKGDNNIIVLSEDVELRSAHIIIRGTDCSILIGKNTTTGGVRIVNVGADCSITIGENCLFADNIELWASDTHSIYDAKGDMINSERSITIGNNVWLGSHVIVLKGISVGDGSVIGMGSVVTKNVPAHVVSVGNPNRTVRSGVSWSLNYMENGNKT